MNKPKRKIVSETGKYALDFRKTKTDLPTLKKMCCNHGKKNYFIVKTRPQTHYIF